MNLFLLFFSILLSPTLSKAKIIKLLEVPMDDGSKYSYSVETKKRCSFSGVKEIIAPEIKAGTENGVILEKINLIQKKLNLEIDKKEITPKHIVFSLKSSTNISFEFFFDKKNCSLQKRVHVGEKIKVLKEMKIEYSDALVTPVLEKITIKSGDEDLDYYIYPWALRGQVSTYEFSLGPALNMHSNIRVNNLNQFEKDNPVIEPIPAFFFRYGTIFLNKDGLGSLIYHKNNFSLLVLGILEGEPYKTNGLERKRGFFLGGIAKFNLVELLFYKDFFKNRGTNLKLNLAPEFFPKLDWKIKPQLFLQYWDREYVDYYFGVNPEEVTSERKIFEGKPTLNFGAMFEAMHFVDKWTFVMSAGVKSYGKEVYASPTVVRQNELRFISSVLYKFF